MADEATTEERDTRSRGPITRVTKHPVKAEAVLLKGTIGMIDADGFAVPATAANTLLPGGRVKETVDATGYDDGDLFVEYEEGIFEWTNAEASNNIALAETGDPAYALNNQTVTKTAGSNSKLGKIFELDTVTGGVWVQVEKGIV